MWPSLLLFTTVLSAAMPSASAQTVNAEPNTLSPEMIVVDAARPFVQQYLELYSDIKDSALSTIRIQSIDPYRIAVFRLKPDGTLDLDADGMIVLIADYASMPKTDPRMTGECGSLYTPLQPLCSYFRYYVHYLPHTSLRIVSAPGLNGGQYLALGPDLDVLIGQNYYKFTPSIGADAKTKFQVVQYWPTNLVLNITDFYLGGRLDFGKEHTRFGFSIFKQLVGETNQFQDYLIRGEFHHEW